MSSNKDERKPESKMQPDHEQDIGNIQLDERAIIEFENKESHDDDDDDADADAKDEADKGIFPPISPGEKFRDGVLRILDGQLFQFIGIVVLFFVILDGAFFFFLLIGGHAMCDSPSRTDCDPRNWWYNFSVQVLNGLFTWMAIVSVPWRCTNWMHIAGWGCPHRNNQVGRDLYGFSSDDIWFNIPLRKRGGIIIVLLLNCLAQFFNQVTRFKFSNFHSQNEFPGNVWTNIFFALSFIFAAIGGGWLVYEETQLRKVHPPGTFPPGLLDVVEPYICCCKKQNLKKQGEEQLGGDLDPEAHLEHYDPTRHASLNDIVHVSRPEFRLFGL